MTISGWEQLAFIAVVTAVAAPLLGKYLAATFRGGKSPGDRSKTFVHFLKAGLVEA